MVVQDATKAVKDERKYDKINYLVQTRKPYQDQVSRSTKNLIEAVDSSFQNTNKKKWAFSNKYFMKNLIEKTIFIFLKAFRRRIFEQRN